MEQQHRKTRVALLSIISNATLVVFKIIVGIVIGSVSVISEGIHSGMDLVASVIAYFSVKTSSLPADENHPFGHGKIENISGTIEALLIFIAAGWIIFEAVKKFMHPEPMETALLGVGIMLVSAVLNMIVSHMLFKVGKETDSVALQADAWHLRTDVYTSAGVMTGLALIWLGQMFFPGYSLNWLDPLCAIFVALLIIKAAYDLTVESAKDLLDANLPAHEEASIRSIIESFRPVVRGFHAFRTRKAGHFRFIEFHIQADARMALDEAHRLTQQLTKSIKEELAHSTVTIHIEPCLYECSDKCIAGCFFSEKERLDLWKRKNEQTLVN